MAGIKIINLPAAPSAQLTDVFPVSQGGVTYKESNSQLLSLFQTNGQALTSNNDTNVTLTLGGSPSIALVNAASITSGWAGQLAVPRGGTGNSTFTAYSVICAGTTATGAFQNVSGVGTSNQVLVSNGAGMLPSWQSVPGLTPAALTKTDDTNVTLTLGGTPATALLEATSITAGWTGTLSGTRGGTGVNNGASTITLGGSLTTSGAFASTFTMTNTTSVTFPTSGTLATTSQLPSLPLSLANGGTNANLTASNGGIFYSTATAGAILSGTATAGQMLQSGASTTPAWSTSTYPATNAINTLLYASSANVMAALATANSSVLVTNGSGVPSLSTTLPSGLTIPGSGGLKSFQIFTSGTAATYTRPAGITSILVEVIGGGGGGGGGAGTAIIGCAGGGGGGGYARLYVASASSTYTYTVGAAGAAGVAGNNAGGAGGTTTFSASSLQATGGNGGGGAANGASNAVLGGAGGVGSNGNINSQGQPGGPGLTIGGAAATSGNGGCSLYGGGALGVQTANTTGNTGGNYGGGGSGALATSTNTAGGPGSAGLIIIWEYA